MPYPPPASPPTLSIFQAIGKVPELPDPTGNAGKFLETDGAVTLWSPVSGGGGVITSIGPVAGPYAFGAAITGIGSDVLQLGAADPTNPGVITTANQTVAGTKLAIGGQNTSVYDARLQGGLPIFNNVTPSLGVDDLGPAWYNTIASWSTNIGVSTVGFPTVFGIGNVDLPEGVFYTSMPLCVPGSAVVSGKGWLGTFVSAGLGNASTPSQVQGFAGPVFYVTPPYQTTIGASTNFPAYDSPLVGAVGQSILIDPAFIFIRNNNQWFLQDAPDWVKFGVTRQTNFGLQLWARVDGPAPVINYEGAIFGSQGPVNVWINPGDHIDRAFAVNVVCLDGVNYKFRAYLTTNPDWDGPFNIPATGTLYSIDSSAITLGVAYNLEISYDGAHFAFYVDGVNQGNTVVSGPIIQAPWEGVTIGAAGPELSDFGNQFSMLSVQGAVYSIRLSDVARHTGTGSFTPPSTAYTWDANTCALYNFDIPNTSYQPVDRDGNPVGPLYILPFVMGQARAATAGGDLSTNTLAGPVPHYIRVVGSSLAQNVLIRDLCIQNNASGPGIVTTNAPEFLAKNIYVNNSTSYGIRVGTAVSFYSTLEDCRVSNGIGFGFQYFGDGLRLQTQGCGIGTACSSGNVWSSNNQPDYKGWACMLLGPAASQSSISVKSSTVDTEFWLFRRSHAMTMVHGSGLVSLVMENNGFSAQRTEGPPILFVGAMPDGDVLSLRDEYFPNTDASIVGLDLSPATVAVKYSQNLPGSLLLLTPTIYNPNNVDIPKSNVTGFVTVMKPSQVSNWKGISLSDTQANNLAGTFTIRGAFTSGTATFLTPEPDANYLVTITPKSALGGSPAAGSNRVIGYTTTQNGFTATTEVAPGGDVELTFNYQLLRVFPPPLLFSYEPAIPSTFTNPLSGEGAPWFCGVVLVPITGNLIAYDTSIAAQQVAAMAGTTPGTDWWKLALGAQVNGYQIEVGSTTIDVQSAVAVNGKLASLHSPGAHNLIAGVVGTGLYWNLDGIANGTGPADSGIQQTPIYVGELYDTTLPLTSATVRNLKFSNVLDVCISNDCDIGPGTQAQALILGDEVSWGAVDASGTGGYAGQIQTNKYGTSFYHSGTLLNGGWVNSIQSTGVPGLSRDIWAPFQGQIADSATLEALIIFAGIHDILDGKTSTAIMAEIRNVIEGAFASATWRPPTSALTPIDQRAFAVITCARGPGTANYTINGTAIASVWNTSSHQTVLDTQATIVASALNTDWVTTLQENPPGGGVWGIILNWRAPGTVGNNKAFVCDGGAGSFCFGNVGDNVPTTGLSVLSFNGLDSTCVINSTTFVANFDTDAATTVNALVSDINASGAVNTLVTASNVANQCFIIANTRGLAGSDITISGSGVNTSGGAIVGPFGTRTLQGGEDGAIQKGIGTILLCNLQPFKGTLGYTVPKDAERIALNATIGAYTGAGVTIVDVESTLWDALDHLQIDPTLGTNFTPNATGHLALYALIQPLLP